jgi:hypothetical protein
MPGDRPSFNGNPGIGPRPCHRPLTDTSGYGSEPVTPSFETGSISPKPSRPSWSQSEAKGIQANRDPPGWIDGMAVSPYVLHVKTTIDLPDDLLHRAKVAAAQRRTTLKELVQTGLDWVLRLDAGAADRPAALARLQKGLRLGGHPLSRDQAHERH